MTATTPTYRITLGPVTEISDSTRRELSDGLRNAASEYTSSLWDELYRNAPESSEPVPVDDFDAAVTHPAADAIFDEVLDRLRTEIDRRLPWSWEGNAMYRRIGPQDEGEDA